MAGITTNTSIAPSPRARRISDIRDKLMRPALTSSYECWFFPPNLVIDWVDLKEKRFSGSKYQSEQSELLCLSCSEASLPGSSFATHEVTGDYSGVTQKHAYRRMYDDRADFTFYVSDDHFQIHFFESWMSYIVNEQFADQKTSTGNLASRGMENADYYYRVNYPNQYRGNVIINKFEKDYGRRNNIFSLVPPTVKYTQYNLMEAFPISINSMPVSYDSSNVLKCTVSFAYTRYTIDKISYNVEKLAKAVQNADGSWTVDISDGNGTYTTIFSNAKYQQLLLQGATP